MLRFAILMLCTIGLASCLRDRPCTNMEFSQLSSADRVEVTTNNAAPLRSVRGSAAVAPFVNFISAHSTGWADQAVGTPVALLNINFYAGNKFLGNFGVGSNFLTAPGCGGFNSRDLSTKDRAAIMVLLAVRDPYKN